MGIGEFTIESSRVFFVQVAGLCIEFPELKSDRHDGEHVLWWEIE